MNEVKYQITQLIFLIILGVGAYWALTHLDTGVTYSRDNIVIDTDQQEEMVPDNIVNSVENQGVLTVENSTDETNTEEDTTVSTEENQSETTNEEAEIIGLLQKLIDDNVTMDSGSNGERVGSVQKFLAYYFDEKNVSIDNDFGPTTKSLVKEFQTKELNGGDGRIGPNTLKAMISYLKN